MPPVCSNRWRRRLVSLDAAALGDARQVPDRLDRDLGAVDLAARGDHAAVRLQLLEAHRVLELGHGEPRLGHRDRRPDVQALGELLGERLADDVAIGVERDDLLRVGPLRMGPDRLGGRGVGEVGPVQRIEAAGGDRQRPVERVGAGMGADHVAPAGIADGADHRPARGRARRPPDDLRRLRPARPRMRGQRDVAGRARPGGRLHVGHRIESSARSASRDHRRGDRELCHAARSLAIGQARGIH